MKIKNIRLVFVIILAFFWSCQPLIKKNAENIPPEFTVRENGPKISNHILPQKAVTLIEKLQSDLEIYWVNQNGVIIDKARVNGTYLGRGYIITAVNLQNNVYNEDDQISLKFVFNSTIEAFVVETYTPVPLLLILKLQENDVIKFNPQEKLQLNLAINKVFFFEKVYWADIATGFIPPYFSREAKIMGVIKGNQVLIATRQTAARDMGAPVFNQNGDCIGIVSGNFRGTQDVVIIPSIYIEDLIKSVFVDLEK